MINKKKKNNKTPFTSSSTDNYVCGVGILAVLAIGVAYFWHITLLRLQIKIRSMKNNNQNDVICFRSDDEKTLYNK